MVVGIHCIVSDHHSSCSMDDKVWGGSGHPRSGDLGLGSEPAWPRSPPEDASVPPPLRPRSADPTATHKAHSLSSGPGGVTRPRWLFGVYLPAGLPQSCPPEEPLWPAQLGTHQVGLRSVCMATWHRCLKRLSSPLFSCQSLRTVVGLAPEPLSYLGPQPRTPP